MRRGDVYVAAARGAYTGKPRPVVIVQDEDHLGRLRSEDLLQLNRALVVFLGLADSMVEADS